MRFIRNLYDRSLNREDFENYIEEDVIRVRTYNEKKDFPLVGKRSCIYIDISDKMQAWVFNDNTNDYEQLNEFNIIRA